MGASSEMVARLGEKCCTRICPQRLKTFWLMAYWNPFVKARVRIMAPTLITVAVIASRMMNREKDFSRLKAMRRAIKEGVFKRNVIEWSKIPGARLLVKYLC